VFMSRLHLGVAGAARLWSGWLYRGAAQAGPTTSVSILPAAPPNTFPVLPAIELLRDRRESINRLDELAGTTQSHFERYYLSVLRRFAAWTQQLPASEAHHHAYPGGLLDHGLEVAVAALRFRQGALLPPGAPPEEAVLKRDLWTYAIFTLALLHDAAKPAVDQTVTIFGEDSAAWPWNPWTGSLSDDPNARWYRVDFRRQREYRTHQRAGLLLAPRLVGEEGLAWLASDPAVFSVWLAYASGDTAQAGPVADLLTQADRESVARSLGARSPVQATPGGAQGLHEMLRTTLRHLIDSGELPLNRRGAAGFRSGDDLWLLSKRAMDAVRAYGLRTGHSEIPTENTRLFDSLQDHGLLIPNAEGRAIWRMVVTVDGHADSLTLLRIPIAHLWANPETAPPTFDGTVEPEALPAEPTLDSRPSAREPEVAAVSSPAVAPTTTTTPRPATLGRQFLDWISTELQAGRLEYNSAKARVHVVPEGVLLASPGIFRDYATATGTHDFTPIQNSFLKLKLHQTTTAGFNVHQYAVTGSGAVISGILLADPRRLFGTVVPAPNPHLVRQ
jgi:integrating conjugative element relaxase (TIGR03760 family)